MKALRLLEFVPFLGIYFYSLYKVKKGGLYEAGETWGSVFIAGTVIVLMLCSIIGISYFIPTL